MILREGNPSEGDGNPSEPLYGSLHARYPASVCIASPGGDASDVLSEAFLAALKALADPAERADLIDVAATPLAAV